MEPDSCDFDLDSKRHVMELLALAIRQCFLLISSWANIFIDNAITIKHVV